MSVKQIWVHGRMLSNKKFSKMLKKCKVVYTFRHLKTFQVCESSKLNPVCPRCLNTFPVSVCCNVCWNVCKPVVKQCVLVTWVCTTQSSGEVSVRLTSITCSIDCARVTDNQISEINHLSNQTVVSERVVFLRVGCHAEADVSCLSSWFFWCLFLLRLVSLLPVSPVNVFHLDRVQSDDQIPHYPEHPHFIHAV